MFKLAADQGYVGALYNLGYRLLSSYSHVSVFPSLTDYLVYSVCYRNGVGLPSDHIKAAELYQQATEQGMLPRSM